uniref:Methenyltetrahydrofolate synthase domain-containing protein n=1 Tax=Tursiops truncatus TaxID=9739 RepID=A0A2U4BBR4_TURTR|nr:methenyltetrahydrofolate synthase domain-containing protein isoform X6 [Tursiops truncatus]
MEPRAGVSKQDIREQIWDYMEARNLADFPRPVHHRIPNFKGASRAAEHFPRLQAFKMARTIKVNPDAPQKNARFFVLNSKKTLLVPTPRLRTGLFNKITPPPGATKDILRKCATSQGVRNYSTPVGLDSRVLVDLVVVGSVAVSEKGWRIGKGEGYADLEYAMMVSMGAVSQGTPVVTIVHDCQVVDIPETLLEDHDLTVDYILTPTRVITTGCERPKPTGIVWSKYCFSFMFWFFGGEACHIHTPCLGRPSPNHWAAGEAPSSSPSAQEAVVGCPLGPQEDGESRPVPAAATACLADAEWQMEMAGLSGRRLPRACGAEAPECFLLPCHQVMVPFGHLKNLELPCFFRSAVR